MPRPTIQSVVLRSMEAGKSLFDAITENGLSVPITMHLLSSDTEFGRQVSELRGRKPGQC